MLPSCGCTMISDWLSLFISAESNPSFFFSSSSCCPRSAPFLCFQTSVVRLKITANPKQTSLKLTVRETTHVIPFLRFAEFSGEV